MWIYGSDILLLRVWIHSFRVANKGLSDKILLKKAINKYINEHKLLLGSAIPSAILSPKRNSTLLLESADLHCTWTCLRNFVSSRELPTVQQPSLSEPDGDDQFSRVLSSKSEAYIFRWREWSPSSDSSFSAQRAWASAYWTSKKYFGWTRPSEAFRRSISKPRKILKWELTPKENQEIHPNKRVLLTAEEDPEKTV